MKTATGRASSLKASRADEDSGGGPRSLSRLLRLFDLLAASEAGMSLAEISAALESPKSSLLNLLRPLVADAYLIQADNQYRLGPRMFRLASRIVARWSFPGALQSQLEALARQTGETVSLAVLDLDHARVSFINVIDSTQPVRYSLKVGMSAQLYCTAAGRLLLAWAEPDWRERYLRKAGKSFKAYTPKTLTDPAQLRGLLDSIRTQGYAVSIGESMPGSGAIAAPVRGPDDRVVAALVIGAPSERLDRRLTELRDAVVKAAALASGMQA